MQSAFRTHSRTTAFLLYLVTAGLIWQGSATAQNAPAAKKRATSTTIKESGKVHSVDRGLIRMISHKGERWVVKITATTKIKLLGDVGPSALRVGTPVRFYAKLDRRGNARGRLEELTIFTMNQDFVPFAQLQEEEEALPLGGADLEPEANSEAAPEDTAKEEVKEKLEDEPGKENPGKEDSEEGLEKPKASPRKSSRTGPVKKSYFIVGVIRQIRGDRITVDAGQGRSVIARIAKTAKVRLDSDDYSLARRGSPIDIVARYYYKPGQATASKVTIRLDDPQPTGKRGRLDAAKSVVADLQETEVSSKPKEPGKGFNVAEEIEREKEGGKK